MTHADAGPAPGGTAPDRPDGAADDADDGPEVPLDLWAALVYEARRGRRMTQPQLARAAGVAQQTISKLERGRLCPHDRVKLRLAAALGVQPSVLFPWPSLDELGAGPRALRLPPDRLSVPRR